MVPPPESFPVGYVSFHDDVGLNFQMNRWMNWIGERAAEDLHRVAARIKTYGDWKREMLGLADEKTGAGMLLDAAYYVRAAEFFMLPGDPDKRPAYDRFLELINSHYGDLAAHRHEVPYETGKLPSYRFAATNPKGAVVIFGGLDSFVEEFLPVVFAVRQAGYDLIAFEGPGQGGALVRFGLPMTPHWHRGSSDPGLLLPRGRDTHRGLPRWMSGDAGCRLRAAGSARGGTRRPVRLPRRYAAPAIASSTRDSPHAAGPTRGTALECSPPSIGNARSARPLGNRTWNVRAGSR